LRYQGYIPGVVLTAVDAKLAELQASPTVSLTKKQRSNRSEKIKELKAFRLHLLAQNERYPVI
jgi:hypothetical protein